MKETISLTLREIERLAVAGIQQVRMFVHLTAGDIHDMVFNPAIAWLAVGTQLFLSKVLVLKAFTAATGASDWCVTLVRSLIATFKYSRSVKHPKEKICQSRSVSPKSISLVSLVFLD